MIKKIGAFGIILTWLISSGYYTCHADEISYLQKSYGDIKIKYVDYGDNNSGKSYKDVNSFKKNYREDLSKCSGVEIDYNDFQLIN